MRFWSAFNLLLVFSVVVSEYVHPVEYCGGVQCDVPYVPGVDSAPPVFFKLDFHGGFDDLVALVVGVGEHFNGERVLLFY